MPKPVVFFRADGNTQIGLGHITRCLALADMLREEFDCVFLVQSPAPAIRAQIEKGFRLIVLPETTDFTSEAHFLVNEVLKKGQCIVLDHYQIRTAYQRILKAAGLKVVCIDDLHAWHFVADAVINHAPGVQATTYSCEPYTRLCLGLSYPLLRPPFFRHCCAPGKPPVRLFMCFGGSDPANFTQASVRATLQLPAIRHITVVVGSAYAAEVEALDKGEKTLTVRQNLDAETMAATMAESDLALLPASSVSLEALAVGVPMLLLRTADNQENIYSGMTNFVGVHPLGRFSAPPEDLGERLTDGLAMLSGMDSPKFPTLASDNFKKLFDELCSR